jgi:hypothetical protein
MVFSNSRRLLYHKSILITCPCCFIDQVPDGLSNVKVGATVCGARTAKKTVTYEALAKKIFIQTDKPIYKPGQKGQYVIPVRPSFVWIAIWNKLATNHDMFSILVNEYKENQFDQCKRTHSTNNYCTIIKTDLLQHQLISVIY